MKNASNEGLIGIKSEFEAEGLTQLEIADYFVRNPWAELRVVKLGGCEAKTDFRAAIRLGANVVVAPMIESVFAAEKFAAMYRSNLTVRRWINLETINGLNGAKEICRFAADNGLSGVVIGRGDLAESMGLKRQEVESKKVQDAVIEIGSVAKEEGLHVGVGGMVSIESVGNLEDLFHKQIIDHFETRKVLISSSQQGYSQMIKEALKVEQDWILSSISNLESLAADLQARSTRIEKSINS